MGRRKKYTLNIEDESNILFKTILKEVSSIDTNDLLHYSKEYPDNFEKEIETLTRVLLNRLNMYFDIKESKFFAVKRRFSKLVDIYISNMKELKERKLIII